MSALLDFWRSVDDCSVVMPYPARLPDLMALARKVPEIDFVHPLTPEESKVCHDIDACFTRKRRNIFLLPDAKTWAIRISLGGTSQTLGICRSATDGFVRFADMAIAYFWRYRTRCALLEAEDNNLNISKARAQSDLANEPAALEHLKEIESVLVAAGYIPKWEDLVALRSQGRKEPNRRTLGARVSKLSAELAKEVSEAKEAVDRSTFTVLESVRESETRLSEEIAKLKDHIAKLTLVMTSVASNLSKE